MTELEKIKRAKMYMDKLANGINPLMTPWCRMKILSIKFAYQDASFLYLMCCDK